MLENVIDVYEFKKFETPKLNLRFCIILTERFEERQRHKSLMVFKGDIRHLFIKCFTT